jgi:hypothetical protein
VTVVTKLKKEVNQAAEGGWHIIGVIADQVHSMFCFWFNISFDLLMWLSGKSVPTQKTLHFQAIMS